MKDERISIKVMQKIPIFRNLNETECRQLADIAECKDFAPGDLVVEQGRSSQNLWVMLEGKCEVVKYRDADGSKRESVVLAQLEPYSHFGEMSFFHPAPHSANVRARSPVRLLKIARPDYDDLIQEGVWAAYKLAYNAVESLADRLRRMDERVTELTHGKNDAPSQKSPGAHEWSVFREKLFNGWNL